jgi:hypothetical protein
MAARHGRLCEKTPKDVGWAVKDDGDQTIVVDGQALFNEESQTTENSGSGDRVMRHLITD